MLRQFRIVQPERLKRTAVGVKFVEQHRVVAVLHFAEKCDSPAAAPGEELHRLPNAGLVVEIDLRKLGVGDAVPCADDRNTLFLNQFQEAGLGDAEQDFPLRPAEAEIVEQKLAGSVVGVKLGQHGAIAGVEQLRDAAVPDFSPERVLEKGRITFEQHLYLVFSRTARQHEGADAALAGQPSGFDQLVDRLVDRFDVDAELGGEIRSDRKAGRVDSGIEPALELRDDIALFVDRSFAHGVTPKNSRQPWGGTSASIRPESASSSCPLQCSLNAVSGPSCRIANRRGSSPKLKNP